MTPDINEIVNDALFQWGAITGARPDRLRFRGWDELSVDDSIAELNASRDLDPTGLTTFMMLRGLTDIYLRQQSFSAYDLIMDPATIGDRLAAMRALRTDLEHPAVVAQIQDFEATIRRAAQGVHFAQLADLDTLLADRYQLAYVRRDALLSMDRLRAYQFTHGDPDPASLLMNPHVWEFWNVNSLVRALRGQRIPGISVVLIRDPDVMHSFFVIGVKNGNTITVLTDKDEEAHPAQRRMSRRPDRQLQRRAAQHWFPYQLLDVEPTEDGRRLYAKSRTALVPIDAVGTTLAGIRELAPAQFVWLLLLCDRIREQYGVRHTLLPELAYTGEMVVDPYTLVGEHGALVTTGAYQPLVLPTLTQADVTNETTQDQWGTTPTRFLQWMVDRYAAQVPESVFNVTGDSQRRQIEAQTGLAQKSEWPGRPAKTVLETLSPETFGTAEHIAKDRVWVARYNQMVYINMLAATEYDAEKKAVLDWYRQRVQANAHVLLDAAARGMWMLPMFQRGSPHHKDDAFFEQGWHLADRNAVTQHTGKRFTGYISPRYRVGQYDARKNIWTCAERPGVVASIFTMIRVRSPQAIALVTGVPFDALPWPLQHWFWCDDEPYTGNWILERLDPIDWILDNPWANEHLDIGITQSKRAFSARRKALGLDPAVYPPE